MKTKIMNINEKKMLFSNRDLAKLLLPLMLEQLLTRLMGTVDTMMVSTVGSAAISAVSLVDSINILLIQLFGALASVDLRAGGRRGYGCFCSIFLYHSPFLSGYCHV